MKDRIKKSKGPLTRRQKQAVPLPGGEK